MFKYLLINILFLFAFTTVGQSKLYLDIKSKFAEKHKVTHIKNVLSYRILESDWAVLAEFGEDYEIWLKDYSVSVSKDERNASLNMEVISNRKEGTSNQDFTKKLTVVVKTDRAAYQTITIYDYYWKYFQDLAKEIFREAWLLSDLIIEELQKLK